MEKKIPGELGFTDEEMRDVEDFILDGNSIKCNKCGYKNNWSFRPSDASAYAHAICTVCGRKMGRGVLNIISSPEDKQHAVEAGITNVAPDEEPREPEPEHKWYAVAIGRQRGVYTSWDEARKHTDGFSGARHKSFATELEAEVFLEINPAPLVTKEEQDILLADYPAGCIPPPDLWDDENKVGGKYMAGVIADFAPALKEIAKLGSMNNKPNGKYERGSWMLVNNPEVEYHDAFWRHILDGHHNIDPESGLPHDVAIAWNAIVLVWFRLKREGNEIPPPPTPKDTI